EKLTSGLVSVFRGRMLGSQNYLEPSHAFDARSPKWVSYKAIMLCDRVSYEPFVSAAILRTL
ncbi:hypothetical protein VU07_03930, partial [Desulfobulbus sp. F4]|nr:hypothetical protein [Desulfobulbus sp. F4]